MAVPIIMPKQGNTVESCTIVEWYKKKGELVKKNDLLFGYETDKAAFDFESPADGTLLDIFFLEQQDVPVLTAVAVIGVPGEDYSALKPAAVSEVKVQPAVDSAREEKPAAYVESVRSGATASGGTGGISPRASDLANRKSVDVSTISGSGPEGRIIERDIIAAVSAGKLLTRSAAARLKAGGARAPETGSGIGGRVRVSDLMDAAAPAEEGPKGEFTETKLSKIRTLIAQRMMKSLLETAQFTVHASANASAMLAYHKAKKGAGFGFADLILAVFAVTRVLPKFPELNSLLTGSTLRSYKQVHLALAVDTPRGLMVPVIPEAEKLSLSGLTTALRTVIASCTDGSIDPDRLKGGTFTVTNLGTFGVESFTPILNPPQVAILGINAIVPKPVYKPETGEYTIEPHLGLSLTVDHRAVDGAPAAQFLKAVVQAIENMNETVKA